MLNKESRRTKMVVFRVSEEEYRTLEAACEAHRIRSMSDLAREAVEKWISGAGRNGGPSSAPSRPSALLDAELERVESRIRLLAQELEQLQRLVQVHRSLSGTASLAAYSLDKP